VYKLRFNTSSISASSGITAISLLYNHEDLAEQFLYLNVTSCLDWNRPSLSASSRTDPFIMESLYAIRR
jgi:hypothetical protein